MALQIVDGASSNLLRLDRIKRQNNTICSLLTGWTGTLILTYFLHSWFPGLQTWTEIHTTYVLVLSLPNTPPIFLGLKLIDSRSWDFLAYNSVILFLIINLILYNMIIYKVCTYHIKIYLYICVIIYVFMYYIYISTYRALLLIYRMTPYIDRW